MPIQIVEGSEIGLSESQRNAFEILVHLTVVQLNRLKEIMELDVPGVVGPTTVRAFDRLCTEEGFELSDAGVNAFKNAHGLGNTGILAGMIGPQTAATYYDEIREALERVGGGGDGQINAAGLALVKEFEGLHRKIPYRPGFVRAYLDPVGIWTIGYGHTAGVDPGDIISFQRAEELLREDLAEFERAVKNLITVELNSNEFSALVSFAFNLGAGALRRSTLRTKLNRNDRTGAADEFLKWNRAGGEVLPGLTRRRRAERSLFLSG